MMFFQYIYRDREQIAGPKNCHATRKSPGHIIWVKALVFILCKEAPLKLYKNESATKSKNDSLMNIVFFSIYIDKEQIAAPKHGHALLKSHGHIVWVRAFIFILYKEDSLNVV
jgi:hypothetical protein